MATICSYNGVDIYGCHGTTMEQTPVFDESGTDMYCSKFIVKVSGFVHAMDTATSPEAPWVGPIPSANSPGLNGMLGGAAQTEAYIRHALSEPRKDFKLRVGAGFPGGPTSPTDSVAIEAKPVNGTSRAITDDLNNGPKPISLKITKITSNNVFEIEFVIELHLLECASSQSALSMVLSNRWTVTDEFNQDQGCMRTIQGRLRIATANVNPHNFRGFVTPRLQPGFRRQRTTYIATADGLNLDYVVIDQEVHFSAPAPATSMTISHRESTGSGMTAIGEVTVSLSGPRTASHGVLLQIAGAIAQAKIGARVAGNGFIRNLDMFVVAGTEQESRVEVRVVKEHVANLPQLQAIGAGAVDNAIKIVADGIGTRLVKPISGADIPGYDSRISVEPGISGKVPITAAFSTYLQSPCYDSHSFTDSKNPAQGSTIDGLTEGYVEEAIVPGTQNLPSSYHSQSHQASIYTFAVIEGRRKADGLVVHMAPAKHSRGASSSSSSPSSQWPDSSAIHLGPPLSKLYVSMVIERAGNYPEVPFAEDFTDSLGIVHTLMDTDILDRSPRVAADGTQIFYTQVEYKFAMSRTLRAGESRSLPNLPWLYNTGLIQYPSGSSGGLISG